MRIHISSPGCRLNQAEIECVATELIESGHTITRAHDADIYIINSCSVTAKSERTVRSLVSRALHAPGASDHGNRVILTGCATDALRAISGVTFVSNDHKHLIPRLVNGTIKPEEINSSTASRFDYTVALRCSTRRVNLKIQDGCDNSCAYCIIPQMRGKPVSKPSEVVLNEFRTLVENNFKEIIITGANIGKYSDGKTDLAMLVDSLLSTQGNFRVHLSSLDPECITRQIVELFHHEKLVRHLHLSLQSGSERILSLMNRRYTPADYMEAVKLLRDINPLLNLTTDVICGFPGETEKDHLNTMNVIREASFSHVHTFRFSVRPGTTAALMKNTVPEITKSERSAEIISLSQEQNKYYYRQFDNRTGIFLSETPRGGFTPGHNEYYVPVRINGRLPVNTFFRIRTFYKEGDDILCGDIIE